MSEATRQPGNEATMQPDPNQPAIDAILEAIAARRIEGATIDGGPYDADPIDRFLREMDPGLAVDRDYFVQRFSMRI